MIARLLTLTWRQALYLAAGVTGLGLLGAVLAYASIAFDLPTIRTLEDYTAPQVTRVYSDDGYLVGRFAHERRTIVPMNAIPEHVVRAFLAAEDAGFYEHEGLDYLGILRAAIKNLRPGAHLQGASTITQQTVKTMVVGDERSYVRKMREAILARELEQLLTKDEILHIYLNQIYFGAGSYGVEEAARTYFGKSVRDLDLGEAAYLAAIPKNPSRYTLLTNPRAAKERQRLVLELMVQHQWAEPGVAKVALEAPIPPAAEPPPYLGRANHYVEHVRRELLERYGEEVTYEAGLVVYTGMSAKAQAGAERSMRLGLEELARRHGYPGPEGRIEVDRYRGVLAALEREYGARREAMRRHEQDRDAMLWDLSGLAEGAANITEEAASNLRVIPLREEARVVGLVEEVDSVGDAVAVHLGCCKGILPLSDLTWARPFSPAQGTPAPRDPSDIFKRGDLVLVEIPYGARLPSNVNSEAPRAAIPVSLVAKPQVEGALVAIDPYTRYVRAMVGGYDPDPAGMLRALQAKRQPGSAFKPVVYAAAVAEQVITPAAICTDSPIVIHDPWTGKPWKPENYEDGAFDGPITYRTALSRSKNTCSVRLLEKLGPEKVIDMARKLGVASELPQNLTLALGTGEVVPIELANAYATLAAGGYRAPPIFIRKITRGDQVLEEVESERELTISPAVAFVVTNMMRSVVEVGTATRAQVLDRPLAGKTGTTNSSRDAWFSGFSPELVATVWVGFDDNQPLGTATGSSAALPIWIRFMGHALDGVERRDFVAPEEGVETIKVDPVTGEASSEPDAIDEVFVAGTGPNPATDRLPSIYIKDDDMAPVVQ